MSSLQSHVKQIPANAGYYITLDASVDIYQNGGTDTAPDFETSATNLAASTVLRDMGKTLVQDGVTFRKVQVLSGDAGTGPLVSSGTDGVAGGAYGSSGSKQTYYTGYIVLPGQGGVSGWAGSSFEPAHVARLG